MWIVCITSVRHVLTVNGYGGRQTKENEKSWCFKGWETLVILLQIPYPYKFRVAVLFGIFLKEPACLESFLVVSVCYPADIP